MIARIMDQEGSPPLAKGNKDEGKLDRRSTMRSLHPLLGWSATQAAALRGWSSPRALLSRRGPFRPRASSLLRSPKHSPWPGRSRTPVSVSPARTESGEAAASGYPWTCRWDSCSWDRWRSEPRWLPTEGTDRQEYDGLSHPGTPDFASGTRADAQARIADGWLQRLVADKESLSPGTDVLPPRP